MHCLRLSILILAALAVQATAQNAIEPSDTVPTTAEITTTKSTPTTVASTQAAATTTAATTKPASATPTTAPAPAPTTAKGPDNKATSAGPTSAPTTSSKLPEDAVPLPTDPLIKSGSTADLLGSGNGTSAGSQQGNATTTAVRADKLSGVALYIVAGAGALVGVIMVLACAVFLIKRARESAYEKQTLRANKGRMVLTAPQMTVLETPAVSERSNSNRSKYSPQLRQAPPPALANMPQNTNSAYVSEHSRSYYGQQPEPHHVSIHTIHPQHTSQQVPYVQQPPYTQPHYPHGVRGPLDRPPNRDSLEF